MVYTIPDIEEPKSSITFYNFNEGEHVIQPLSDFKGIRICNVWTGPKTDKANKHVCSYIKDLEGLCKPYSKIYVLALVDNMNVILQVDFDLKTKISEFLKVKKVAGLSDKAINYTFTVKAEKVVNASGYDSLLYTIIDGVEHASTPEAEKEHTKDNGELETILNKMEAKYQKNTQFVLLEKPKAEQAKADDEVNTINPSDIPF